MTTSKKSLKRNVLRHAEYYDLTEVFDDLYAKSTDGKFFTHLVEIISSENNILLAYINLKRIFIVIIRYHEVMAVQTDLKILLLFTKIYTD